MKDLKVTVMGGGSTYTPELIEGFINYKDELNVEQVVLMDISTERLRIVGDLAARMLDKHGIELVRTTNREEAIAGADFVLSQMRIGGLAARALDERIPLNHGVVGQETTGPGGFAKALRTIPVTLDIARDMERYAPDAWLINFTNPSGMVTEAVLRHSKVKTVGLCNVPINLRMTVARFLDVEPHRVELQYVGLNHLSWTRIFVDGVDRTREVLDIHWGTSGGDVDAGYLKAIGLIPNYYLRYFVHPDRVVEEEKAAPQVRGEYLQKIEADMLKLYEDPELCIKPPQLQQRGGAYYSTAAVELIRSIAQDRRDVHILNVRNGLALPDLPQDSAVEVPAVVGASGVYPLTMGPMPASIRGLVASVKSYEELTIEAAVTGDEDKAKLALLNHPLVPSWDVAVAIWNDLKEAHKAYLPQFAQG